MKKRVLQFIGSFHQGGTERQAIGLTKQLIDEGSFDVFVATLNKDGVLLDEIESMRLEEIPEFKLSSFYHPKFLMQAHACSKMLKKDRIDLIHTHDFYTNIFAMVAAELARVPVKIASKRETGVVRSSGQRRVELGTFKRFDAIVANSNAVRDHLVSSSVPPNKIRLIYNSVCLERFTNGRNDRANICRRFSLPDDGDIRLVTLVANLRHAVKNVPMLLRTASRIVERKPYVHFVVAGEGELETELKDRLERSGVGDNVHFIGRCTDVPALLSISHACVLTSISEGFSNSILEYMAAGKPVVSTNVGGAAEAIVEGETGYLVASDNDEAMAARLVELLGDDNKAAAFGTAGRIAVGERFSQAAQLRATVELYDSLLHQKTK